MKILLVGDSVAWVARLDALRSAPTLGARRSITGSVMFTGLDNVRLAALSNKRTPEFNILSMNISPGSEIFMTSIWWKEGKTSLLGSSCSCHQ